MAVAAAAAALAIAAPAAWAEVYVQNDRSYVGSDGELHVVGEVVNGLGAPVGGVVVHATAHPAPGGEAARGSAAAMAGTIMPGMRAPFDVAVAGAAGAAGHTVEVEYSPAGPRSRALGIASSELVRDGPNVAVSGTVTNGGDVTANSVRVTATLYDRDGKVAAASRAHAVPDYLRPSEEAFFLVPVPEREQAAAAVGYELVAESEEYAAVPEFALGPWAAMAASAAGYAALARYWSSRAGGLLRA